VEDLATGRNALDVEFVEITSDAPADVGDRSARVAEQAQSASAKRNTGRKRTPRKARAARGTRTTPQP